MKQSKFFVGFVVLLSSLMFFTSTLYGLTVIPIEGEDIFSPEIIEAEKEHMEEMDRLEEELKEKGVVSFSDIPNEYWGYEAIMRMVEKGLFSGVSKPIDGIGVFAPDKIMTKAEFITVVTRYLYSSQLENYQQENEGPWYSPNYAVALQEGLLSSEDFTLADMESGMTREEMAFILAKACMQLGEDVSEVVAPSVIPDYIELNSKYEEYVRIVYAKGIIKGVDSQGTFNPNGVLTRSQAATVLYRLVEHSARS